MICDRRRGHHRSTCSRSSSAGCPAMLTTAAVGAGRLVISLAVFFTSSVTGEIRCFCNQPSCVFTSYMCKSHIGLCFLQTTQDGGTIRTVHACAETLSENQRYACSAFEDDVTVTQKSPGEDTRLDMICCRTDMCNYKPRLFINVYISRMNGTSTKESLVSEGDFKSSVVSRWSVSSGQLLWFRVSVIVVPTIGAVLLAVIVYAAVRMLRNDRLLRHNGTTRLRHRSQDQECPVANGCCAEGPLITKPYCILLSTGSSVRPSQWRLQRVCPAVHEDMSKACAEPKRVGFAQNSRGAHAQEGCRVLWERPLDIYDRCCHVCVCEYSDAVLEHKRNRSSSSSSSSSSGRDYDQPREQLRTSLVSEARDKTGDITNKLLGSIH